jgi:hypothetical protein
MEILMFDRIRSAASAWALRLKAFDAAAVAWVGAHPRLTISLAVLAVAGTVML